MRLGAGRHLRVLGAAPCSDTRDMTRTQFFKANTLEAHTCPVARLRGHMLQRHRLPHPLLTLLHPAPRA